jgi:hypothetical protein
VIKLLDSLPANNTHRQKRKKESQTLASYRIQRSLHCCSWLSGIVFVKLVRQKEEPVLFRMYLQMSPKSARAKLLLPTVISTSFQILLRRACKRCGLASGQFLTSWTTISVNYKVFFFKTCLFHVCTCVVDEDHGSSEESGYVLFTFVGMNRCKSRQSR